MSEQSAELTPQQEARKSLFRYNDLEHPAIQVLLTMQLEHNEEEE